MEYRKHRAARMTGCAAAALVALAAPALHAQQAPAQQTPAPAPTPSPTRSGPPNVMYLPNVVPERFSIGESPTPTPAPVPVPSPVTVPTPAARTNAPAARPTQVAPRAAAPAAAASAAPTPTPEAIPSLGSPPPGIAPVATSLPTPAATPAAAPPPGTPGWLWALGGAAGMALLVGVFWALRRRRAAAEPFEAAPEPVVVPEPPLRAAPPGIAPRAEPLRPQSAPQPAPPGANPDDPFELIVRPLRVDVNAQEVVIELELLVGNRQSGAAEAVRPALALISANPDQDRQIAGFLANPLADSGGQPFDLPAGGGGRMPARLRIRREHIHVVEVGGRPMFVPVVMVALRWRGGLSIRRFGAAFMVGIAGQGAKLGPIWLDRAPASAALAATRYLPKQAPVAA